jgi:signal transduction histidine kinase/ActR/RegA family two-component response regulator
MRAVPVRYWLIGLVVLLVVPLATVSSLVFAMFADDQRAAAERQLIETTRSLAIATEWHVVQTIRRLQLLSPRDGPARFSEQAASAIARGEFLEVAFFDETGRLVASQPYVAGVVSIATEEFFRRTLDTRGPYVSDFVRSPITGRPGVLLAVPVRHGRVTGVAVGVPDFSQELLDLMLQQRLRRPEGGGTIMDSRGLYVARTLNPEQTVGQRASAAYLERALASTEGIVRNVNREGQAVYGTFVHTSFGWIAAIGVPASAIERRGFLTMIALSFSGLLVAVGLAALFGHRIASALGRLASAAREAGGGRVPPGRPEWITEVDVTRRALMEAAAQRDRFVAEHARARADADAANRAKDEFLAMLGHELRNPIGAIAGALGVLDLPGVTPKAAERARAVIRRQVANFSLLMEDLLDVSRLASGKMALLARVPLSLAAAVQAVVDVMHLGGRTAGREFSVELAPIWVEADPTRIEQIVTNIIDNALKYTPPGGRVAVRVSAEDDTAVLTVADTGVGIAADVIERVFDLFVQAERPLDRADGGLGIGLTLVKALVTLHGGSITAASDGPGRGATFTVRLPSIVPPSNDRVAARTARAPVGPRRVLIVEDNADAREMLGTALSSAGHEVREAESGAAALDAAATFRPDVGLIDIGLPGVDGYEVARRLRATDGGKGMLLVALTGYGQPEDRRRASAAGFDAHLTKPVLPEQLAKVLDGAHETRG